MSNPSDVRPLGWGGFIVQFVTVIVAYIAMTVPAVVVLGQTNTGVLLATMMGMAGALIVAWGWLRRDGALAEAWDLSRPDDMPHALVIAGGATVAIIAVFTVSGPVTEALGLDAPNVDLVMQFVTESPLSLILWIVLIACLTAGLGEELLWRGFLLDRLLRLPGINGRMWLAIVIQAALFGLPHSYQGWGGVVITGAIGLLFGWMRIAAKWNLWPLVIAHATVDTVMMLLGYASVQGWLAAG